MSDNARKTALVNSLSGLANARSQDQIQLTGRALPCEVTAINGQVATVKFLVNSPFPMVTVDMPVATSKYDWLPVQVGDHGVAVPIDVYQGVVSGLGSGTADLSQRGNLASLRFTPIANKGWTPAGGDGNQNYRIVQGPDGVLLQDTGGKSVVKMSAKDGITLSFGGHSIVINSSNVIIDGKPFLPHTHKDVQSGTSDTGPVT